MNLTVNAALNVLVFGLLAATANVGCHQSKEPLVKASEVEGVLENNLLRSSLGLRLIQDSWVLYRSESDFDDWKANSSDRNLTKRVFKASDGKILEEEDYYYSGAKFTNFDGSWSEFLTVHFDYKSKRVRVLYTGTNENIKQVLSPFEDYSGEVSKASEVVENAVKNW